MHELIQLNEEQIEFVYNNFMKKDFPPSELKPLKILKNAAAKGIYKCFGYFENDEIKGYLFLENLKDKEDYLVDYLAVVSDYRNNGIGAQMLNLLRSILPDAESILVEVEDPDFAESEEEESLQKRRYNFYMRNGFHDTGLRAKCYGVPFRIIETGEGLMHTKAETESLYRSQYKAIWTKKMYETKLFTY